MEQAVTLMQDEMRKNPPEETELFKKNLVAFEAHLDNSGKKKSLPGQLSSEARDKLPAGSRVITIIIPFHIGLVMLKEGQNFKILTATLLPRN
jgi:hypothetical protein